MRTTLRSILPLAALGLALAVSACSAGPPPRQIATARLALEDARHAEAERLAARPFDVAVRYLDAAENTWQEHRDAEAAAHYARLAEGAAKRAQYEAEAVRAEEELRVARERRSKAELAVRDAQIAALQSRARTEAEQRAQDAELRAREEERRRQEEAERGAAASAAAEREAAARAAAEQRASEAETRARDEQLRREQQQQAAAEQAQREAQQREDERRQAEAAHQEELAHLREEQQRTREELRTTLSRLADVRQEARGLIVTLPGSIYFETNKSVIQPAMRSRLSEIGRALAAVPDQSVLIEGHTDSVGSSEYNLELSRLRAEAVRSVLVGAGVAPDRVETQGYGETRPVATNATAAGKAQNRRVEIVLQGAAAPP
jgi:outer membrane protein OmpA-like peptidoglycan-associated protein